MHCAAGSRHLLALTLLATATVATATATAPRFERVPLRDTQMKGARDLAPALAATGSTLIDIPFSFLWAGKRYERLEVGFGWARVRGGVGEASPPGAFARDPEDATVLRHAPAPIMAAPITVSVDAGAASAVADEPSFEVLAGDLSLGPHARVLIAESPFEVVVRWWDLRSATTPGSFAAELVLDRFGLVRYHYLQARGLSAALTTPTSKLRAGIVGNGALRLAGGGELAPGFAIDSGLAIRITRPDDAAGAVASLFPPPPNCVPPTEDFCDHADGPTANTVYLAEGFSSPSVAMWSASGDWHVIADTTCPPGANFVPGHSAYVGNNASCSYASGVHRLTSPMFGPVTANTMLSFNLRFGFPFPGNNAVVLVNGTPIASYDPTTANPSLWYSIVPLSLAAYAGQMIDVAFLFNAPGLPAGIGWMVDDVFVWDEPLSKVSCFQRARFERGNPVFSDCEDVVHSNWSFNESTFCVDCAYTFYLNVECGTEMHFPLLDMEGAEITVTDVIDPMRVLSLECSNDAFRRPTTPPVALTADCCPTPGNEVWYGPAWSAIDNNGPGSVTWGDIGMPWPMGCKDQVAAYDRDAPLDGVQCDELPACGSVLTLLSPGESQVMDCKVVGSPALCGLFRVDVRSGGNIWNLFSNCVGDATPDFDIYYNCEDAWNAFLPLPEIAVANAMEVGSCPDTQIQFDLQNLSCQDLVGDITVRGVSNCAPPDQTDWVIPGGLAAGGTRTETQPMSVTCTAATITLVVDPLNLVAECSENPNAAACNVIPGSDSIQLGACGCAGTIPPMASATTACEGQPTSFSCGVPEPGATYEWDFEDDGTYDATGCNVMYTYPAPGMRNARVRLTTATTCIATTVVVVNVIADTPPNLATVIHGIKASPNGVHFEWAAVTGATSYRVARGNLATFYSHTVDDPLGVGQCDTGGLTSFDDSDDLLPGANYYYLVAPLAACGSAGPWGLPGDATPGPIPTMSCP